MQRIHFLSSGAAAATLLAATPARADVPGGTDLVELRQNFDEKAFIAAINRPADIRQLWDNVALRPNVLGNIRNSLNTLQFGFGYDPQRIALATLNHGPSVSYTYNDYVWAKYGIGDFVDYKDSATGKGFTTNVFLPRKFPANASRDPNVENGYYQDTGITALQERGVVFITCHTAVEEQARFLIKMGKAPAGMSPADVVGDILSHLIPGAIVVPGAVGTVAVMQAKYGYTYITVQ